MKEYFLGVMTGTSLDAYDICLADFSYSAQPNSQPNDKPNDSPKQFNYKVIAFFSAALPAGLKQFIEQINLNQSVGLQQFAEFHHAYSQHLALIINKDKRLTEYKPAIKAIGLSGQTTFHNTRIPMSMTLGSAEVLAKLTGIKVVSDFRVGDMALGGQGAPVAPELHRLLLSNLGARIFVNLGGIANISVINQQNHIQAGFDTGPANCLIDEACQKLFGKDYDDNGNLAKQGKFDSRLIEDIFKEESKAENYFNQAFPKSTGRDKFNLNWLKDMLGNRRLEIVNAYDLLANITEFTAISIASQIYKVSYNLSLQNTHIHIVFIGGGAKNEYLIERIMDNICSQASDNFAADEHETKFIEVKADAVNLNLEAVESLLMAWLAYKRVYSLPTDLTKVTGTNKPMILGGLWSGI